MPHAEVVHDDGSDVEAAARAAADADVALVVVGYTYADEGEYIGDAGVDLRSLMPEKDDPALVARFEAETETRRPVDTPEHVRARRDEGGFARGGDRTSLRLRDDEVALIHAVAAANPRTVVAIVAGSAVVISEWDHEVPAIVQSWYAGMEGGHALADVLLGVVDVGGAAPVHRARTRGAPAPVRPRRHPLRLRPLARLVEARSGRQRTRVSLRVRPRLHHVRAGGGKRRGGRGRDPGPGDVAQHGIAERHRRRADLCGRPDPTRRVRTHRDRTGRDRRARHHGVVRDARGPGCRAARHGRAAGHLRAPRRPVRGRRGHPPHRRRSADLLHHGHHVGREEPQVAL